MRFVVTGHLGFIGSHLCPELESRGHEVVGFDRADGGPDLVLNDVFHAVLEAELREGPVDRVIHLAAQPGRVFGAERPRQTISLNAHMTMNIVLACAELGVPLCYTSTSEVYGDHGERVVDEFSPKNPRNFYGMTKLWGEQISQFFAPEDLLIVRPTMPYGPGLPAGHGRAALMNFLQDAICYRPLLVHRDTKRSWCYVDDLIAGFVTVLENAHDGVYNVGRDDDLRPMLEVARMCCEAVGVDYRRLIVTAQADLSITPVKNLSTERLRSLGFEPAVSLQDGLRRTYEWLTTGR